MGESELSKKIGGRKIRQEFSSKGNISQTMCWALYLHNHISTILWSWFYDYPQFTNAELGQKWLGQSVPKHTRDLHKWCTWETRSWTQECWTAKPITLAATYYHLPDHRDHPPPPPGPHTHTLSLPIINYCAMKRILHNKQPQNAGGLQHL